MPSLFFDSTGGAEKRSINLSLSVVVRVCYTIGKGSRTR